MSERVQLRYSDGRGNRLVLVFRPLKNGTFRVYAAYTKDDKRSVGASGVYANQQLAHRALDRLEARAIQQGWELQVPVVEDGGSSFIQFGADGERLFRDRLTGKWVPDESSSRPPTIATSKMTYEDAKAKKPKNENQFTIETLPKP